MAMPYIHLDQRLEHQGALLSAHTMPDWWGGGSMGWIVPSVALRVR